MVSRKSTGRADPSQITSFLCFTCGDLFNSNVDYQKHIIEHQAMSLIHQLYYYEQEYQATKDDSKFVAKENSAQPMIGRRNTEPAKRLDDIARKPIRHSDDYESKEDSRKRAIRMKIPTAQETVKVAEQSVRRASFKEIITPISSSAPKMARIEPDERVPPVVKFTESHMFLEQLEDTLSCDICPPNTRSFKYPVFALSHLVNDHKGIVNKHEMCFYSYDEFLHSVNPKIGDYCPECAVYLSPTEAQLHMVEKHLAQIVEKMINMKKNQVAMIEKTNKVYFNSHLTLPTKKECVISIKTTLKPSVD